MSLNVVIDIEKLKSRDNVCSDTPGVTAAFAEVLNSTVPALDVRVGAVGAFNEGDAHNHLVEDEHLLLTQRVIFESTLCGKILPAARVRELVRLLQRLDIGSLEELTLVYPNLADLNTETHCYNTGGNAAAVLAATRSILQGSERTILN